MGLHVAVHPLVGMVAVLLLLGGLLGGVRLAQHSRALQPEPARKLFHVGAGLIVLGFPWLFGELWPVLVLAGVTIPALIALKHMRALRAGLGTVLFAVNRGSLGEVCLPVAALVLFTLSARCTLLYCVPLLILTFADSAAAIVGTEHGRRRFRRIASEKSLEGSLAFFAVAALSALIPLLLAPACNPSAAVLLALILALLLTPVEALSPYGLDNITVPLIGYPVLRAGLALSVEGDAAMLLGALLLSIISYRLLTMPCRHERKQWPRMIRAPKLGTRSGRSLEPATCRRQGRMWRPVQTPGRQVSSRRMPCTPPLL